MRAGLVLLAVLAACSSRPPETRVQDGSSLATALVLHGGAGGMDPTIAEYDWIQAHRPGARVVGEGELRQGGRVYDVVAIVRRGVGEHLYFDITGTGG